MPMSYNSWLYVYSNPINLRDPSGKYPSYCYYIPPEQRKNVPDCSSDLNFTPEGIQAFQLYQLYKRSAGYWNNWQAEIMQPETFLGLMVTFEIGDAYRVPQVKELVTEAVARTLWTGDRDPKQAKACNEVPCYGSSSEPPTVRRKDCSYNPPYCQGGYCFAGVFNFIGRQVSSAQSRFSWTEINSGNAWDWPKYFGSFYPGENPDRSFNVNGAKEAAKQGMEFAKRAGYEMWHPKDPSWKIFNENRPIIWGNGSMWNKTKAQPMFTATGSNTCNEDQISNPNYRGAVCAFGTWNDKSPNDAWMLVTPAQRKRLK